MDTINKLFAWCKSHLLATILIFATVLRLFLLDKVPPSLNWDEVSMGYSAYSIMETGRDEWGEFMPMLFRSFGEWKSPVYIYLIVPFIKIFGLNAWGVRLPAALAGIVTIYLTYLLGRKLYSEKVGLWAAFLLTVSPWHLMLSRPAYEAGVALMLLLLGIYLLLLAIDSKNIKYWVLSAISFGLGPHTYNSAKIIVPLIVIYLIISLRKKWVFKQLLVFGAILAMFALPLLLSLSSGRAQGRYKQVGITTDAEVTTNFYEYRKTFPAPAIVNRVIFSKYSYFVVKGIQNWASYFSPSFLLTQGGPRPQHNIPYRGVLYIAEIVLIGYGLVGMAKYKGIAKSLPFLLIAIGFIPAALTKDAFHVLRSIMTLPAWQLLASIGMVYLIERKSPIKNTITILLAAEILIFMFQYYAWYPKAFARDWQYGYKEAVQYAETHKDQYQDIIFTKWYGEPQLFLAFYGKLDPREFQKDNIKLKRYEELGLPWLDQLEVYKIGKYSFTSLDWKGPGDNKNTLYIGKSDDFWVDTTYLKQIKFPDGSTAFNIVEGQ